MCVEDNTGEFHNLSLFFLYYRYFLEFFGWVPSSKFTTFVHLRKSLLQKNEFGDGIRDFVFIMNRDKRAVAFDAPAEWGKGFHFYAPEYFHELLQWVIGSYQERMGKSFSPH
jgi:hypothetical protein